MVFPPERAAPELEPGSERLRQCHILRRDDPIASPGTPHNLGTAALRPGPRGKAEDKSSSTIPATAIFILSSNLLSIIRYTFAPNSRNTTATASVSIRSWLHRKAYLIL